jgi:predicted RNase H-like HicB family nuclease
MDSSKRALTIELDREVDGRWIAAVPELPGVSAYGATRDDAIVKVKAVALREVLERLEHGEPVPDGFDPFVIAAA